MGDVKKNVTLVSVVLTCAMGTVLIDSSSAPACERLPDAGKQGGPRAA